MLQEAIAATAAAGTFVESLVARGVGAEVAGRVASLGHLTGTTVSIPVGNSTVISFITWDSITHELKVSMTTGRVYVYPGTHISTVEAFAAAPSKGHFYNEKIKGATRPQLSAGRTASNLVKHGLRALR
jgi:KTSC domain